MLYFVFYFYYRARGFKFIGFNPICIYYRVRGFKFIGFNPICIYVKDIYRVSTGIQKWLRGFFIHLFWFLFVRIKGSKIVYSLKSQFRAVNDLIRCGTPCMLNAIRIILNQILLFNSMRCMHYVALWKWTFFAACNFLMLLVLMLTHINSSNVYRAGVTLHLATFTGPVSRYF